MRRSQIPKSRNPEISKTGFTLVELLVVITIIGILIALLLPAVQAAREAARRMHCSNNMKQVGFAKPMYHDANNQFPVGYGYLVNGVGARWPWTMRALPFLEQESLGLEVDWSREPYLRPSDPVKERQWLDVIAAQLPVYLCPSDPTAQQRYNANDGCNYGVPEKGRVSYGANFGIGTSGAAIERNIARRAAGPYPYDTFGVTELTKRCQGAFGPNYGAAIRDIRDGTTNTLLLAELIVGELCTCRGTVHFAEGGLVMATYVPNDLTPDRARECDSQDYYTGDAPCDRAAAGAYNVQHTARSRHPGGVNVTMCDGSVQFVSQNIVRGVWQAMATPDVGEPAGGEF